MKELEWSQDFPIITLWELSVAMETRVLIRSYPKLNAINPPPQWCFWWNLIIIGQLVSEIFMIESVDGRTDRRTPARVTYYKLTLSLRLWWAKKHSSDKQNLVEIHLFIVNICSKNKPSTLSKVRDGVVPLVMDYSNNFFKDFDILVRNKKIIFQLNTDLDTCFELTRGECIWRSNLKLLYLLPYLIQLIENIANTRSKHSNLQNIVRLLRGTNNQTVRPLSWHQ